VTSESIPWLALGLLCICLVLLAFIQGRRDPYADAEGRRPNVLAGARVIAVGQALSINEPFALHGEPDTIYLTARGTILIREDKTGFPHALAEQIQLSVYGALIRHGDHPEFAGRQVETYGLVRYGIPGKTKVRWVKVPLLNDQQLGALVQRYRQLGGAIAPTRTGDAGMCSARCSHLGKRCPGHDPLRTVSR